MSFSRIERVQELLREEIARIVDRKLDNPKLPPFITIHAVKVSRDLHYATVLVTFLEDATDETIKETIVELNRSAGYIGRLVAQRTQLRRHPQLKFAYNASTHYALDLERIFQQIHHEHPEEENSDAASAAEDGEAADPDRS